MLRLILLLGHLIFLLHLPPITVKYVSSELLQHKVDISIDWIHNSYIILNNSNECLAGVGGLVHHRGNKLDICCQLPASHLTSLWSPVHINL